MKTLQATFIFFIFINNIAFAQKTAQVKEVLNIEKDYNKVLGQKGIRNGTLSMIEPDAIVFKPEAVSAKTYFTNNENLTGKQTTVPKIARISASGDLAFSAGTYTLKETNADDNEYGEYLSIWRTDLYGQLKLLFNIDMQHPESDKEQIVDFKDPTIAAKRAKNEDPFNGKSIILTTDKIFNSSFTISSVSAYKEFLNLDARYYFPGFEPIIGQDKILQFISNQAISIEALNTGAGRSISGDLAYSYGKAKIKKGSMTNNYNYIRMWEPDKKTHKWNILVEIFSPIEK